jgi:hypothetical protein
MTTVKSGAQANVRAHLYLYSGLTNFLLLAAMLAAPGAAPAQVLAILYLASLSVFLWSGSRDVLAKLLGDQETQNQEREAWQAATVPIRRILHQRWFPPIPRHLSQAGAIGTDIERHHRTGRQSRSARRRQSGGQKKTSDDAGGDGDGEPAVPVLWTRKEFAKILRITPETLSNRVSAGTFPRPIWTAFGPRYTQQHLDHALTPPAPSRGRVGRPRIAQSLGKKGCSTASAALDLGVEPGKGAMTPRSGWSEEFSDGRPEKRRPGSPLPERRDEPLGSLSIVLEQSDGAPTLPSPGASALSRGERVDGNFGADQ